MKFLLWLRLVPAVSLVSFGARAFEQVAAEPAKPLTIAQVWRLDAVYTDAQHGVSFRYPSSWKATTECGNHQPALAQSEEAKPIAGFGYIEGGFPRQATVGPYTNTNLEDFGIVYSAIPATSVTECETKAASIPNEHGQKAKAMFGGRTFSVYETGEGGVSQSVSGKLYVTYVQSTCYLFETDVAVASPGVVDNIPALTQAQSDAIEAHLLGMMKSVRIVAKVI